MAAYSYSYKWVEEVVNFGIDVFFYIIDGVLFFLKQISLYHSYAYQAITGTCPIGVWLASPQEGFVGKKFVFCFYSFGVTKFGVDELVKS